MQVRGTTTSRNKTKEEEEKRRKGQPVGTKQTGSKPKTNATKPKTSPQKPKMTEAKAGAQQSRTNTRTNTTRTQLTDGGSTRKPKTDTRRTDPMARMQAGRYQKDNGLLKPRQQTRAQAAAGVAKGLATLAKNDVKKAGRTLSTAAQRAENQQKRTNDVQMGLTKEQREHNKRVDYQIAQARAIRDDKKAHEATDKLPKHVKKLLDEYNKTVDARQHTQMLGGGVGDLASNYRNAVYLKQISDKQGALAKQLQDAGYKNYEELAAWRKRLTDKKATRDMEKDVKQFAAEHPTAAFLASRALTVPAAATGLVESLSQGVRGGDAQTMNTRTAGFAGTRIKNALDEGVTDTFEDGKISAKWKTRLYNTLASSADSLQMSLLPAGEALFFASAGTEGVMKATERGAGRGKALLSGLASGTAELAGEHLSIGQFKKLQDSLVKGGGIEVIGTLLGNLGKNTLVNASEEAATEVMNKVSDWWINGGASEHNARKMELMLNGGMGAQAAEREAWRQDLQDVGEAGLGGAMQAVFMGGAGSFSAVTGYNSAMQQAGAQIAAQDGGRERLLTGAQDARESGALNERQRRQAEKLAGQIETAGAQDQTKQNRAAQRRDNRRMGELADLIDTATAADAAGIVTEEARKRLQKLGETGDAQAIAQAIGETVTGTAKSEKAAKRAQETIANSRYGTRVLNEAGDTDGQFSSGWTQQMVERLDDLHARRYEGQTNGERGGKGDVASPVSAQERAATISAAASVGASAQSAEVATGNPHPRGEGKGAAGVQKKAAKAVQSMNAKGQEAAQVYFENQVLKGEVEENAEQIYKKEFADFYRWGQEGQITKEQAVAEDTVSGLSDSAKAAAFEAGRQAARAASNVEAEETTPSVSAQERAASSPRRGAEGVQQRVSQRQIVTGIESVREDGEVIMRTKDGGTVALSDAGLDNETAWIAQQAAEYGGQTADAFFQGFAPGVSPKGYSNAFSTYYNAGQLGKQTFEQFQQTADAKVMLRYLGEVTARKAFEAGRANAETATQETESKEQTQKKSAEKREGSYTSKAAMDEAVDTMLQALSKKTGIDFERLPAVFAGKMEANGKFIRGIAKIEISDNAQNEFATLFHELTHAGAAYNLNSYAGYMGAILQWYQQNYGHNSLKERLQEIYRVYNANDASFTESKAVEEFVCEATAGLFSTEDGAQDFVDWLQNESGYTAEQKKTVLQRVAELFQRIVDRIKELIGEGNLSEIAADFAEAQADEAARLRQMFLDVLDGMNVEKGTSGENKFSLKDIEKYNAKTYNERGWALVNDVLTLNEYSNFMQQLSDNKNLDFKYPTLNGETMILVTDKSEEGYSKLVFFKGTFKHPVITRVIDANSTNPYYKSLILEEALNYGQIRRDPLRIINSVEGEEVLTVRTRGDFDSYRGKRAEYQKGNNETNNSNSKDNQRQSGSDGEDSGDVSYSLPMGEQMDKLRLSLGLEAQNRSLLQQNEQLRELNRRQGAQIREMQKTLTKSGVETFADSRKVEQFASRIQRDYKTTRGAAARGEIAQQLEDLYHDMANNVLSRDVTQTRAEELAERILKQSDYNQPQVSEYSQAVIDDVKSVGVQLSDAQKAEAAYRYGSYGAFYRASMGAMKIRNDGMPLDQRWAELAEAHPAVFDANASEADQALLLFEAVRALQNDYIDDNGFDFDEAKEFLTGQILDGFRDAVGSAQQLTAKQKQNIKKELDARQATIEKLKAQIKQERAQAKAQAKEDVRKAKTEAAAAVRAEFDDKFLANRARYEQRVQNIAETQQKGSQRRYIEKRITRFQRMLAPTRGNDNIVQPLRELVGRVVDIIPQSGREVIRRDSWNELELEYRNLRDNNEDFAGIYGDVFATIGQDIEQMKEETSGKRFSQLTLRQLQTMARIMDHINAMVKNEQEVIIDGRKQRTAAAGQQAMEEAAQNAQQRKLNVGDNLRTFDVNNQKPVYFFRRIGGVMQQLFNDTRKGQDVWARNVQKGKQFFSETFEKYHARDWMQDEQTFTLHDWQGREREDVTLTVGQMLSLYATAKREGVVAKRFGEKQTMHLLGGGFCFEDQWVKKGSGKSAHYEMEGDAHQLVVDDVLAIANALTDEQKAYADEMVRYLSTDMAKLGNDVTMQLYGFNMFNEGYYFPLNVKKTFLFQKFGEQGESMLQAMGFTNATKYNANTPIILSEFDQVWAGHVERMSTYNALVIPINSMQRVWNYKENDGPVGQMKQKTMAQTFTQSYGKAYASYFQQFMRDINGDVVGDKREEALNGLIRRFKKNAVFASASVTIQQPSAVMRAMAYIDPKYFAATAGVNRSKMYAEAKQYSGLAIIKELGGFDVGSGRTAVDWMMETETKPRTAKEKAAALVDFKDSSYRDDIFGKPAGKADEITWAHIWAACKKKVQVEERLSGEALNERTAEVFNNVIDLTQVYDSVFSRSANMRSKSGLMQAATAFMGEPTTTINMLEDALRSKDKKFAAKVVAACTAQILFNAALKSIITAARDDDEDKNPFEKYVAQVFGNFLDDLNPLGMVPYFRDVLSLLKGFDVGRSELAVVEDLIDTFKKVMTGDDPFSWESVKGLLGALGPFIDLPARNVLRDVDAIGNTVRGFQSGTKPTKAGMWYAIKQELLPIAKNFGIVTEDSKAEQLYAAFVSEDDEMYARMAQKYKTGAAVKSALVGQIKTAYEGGEITRDEAVELLLRLPAYNEQKAKQETRHWVADLQDELMAMNPENEIEKTGGYYTLDSMKRDKEEAEETGYKVATDWAFLQNAIQQQDAKAIKEEIAQLKQFGKSDEDIQEKLRLYIKNNDKDVQAAGQKYKNGDVSVLSEGALGMIASRYGIDNTEVMRMIRTEAGVSNNPIEGTIWQLNDLKRAIESGSNMTYDIKWAIVKAKEQQFQDKKNPTSAAFESLRASLSSYFKPKWQAADAAGRAKIRQQLIDSACWPNTGKLDSDIRKWK